MDRTTNREFISKTESLVKPQDVTAISFLGDFNKMFPKKLQEKTMLKGSSKIPYMGFIVDPYCLFLAYKIENLPVAEAMLPPGYALARTSVFKDQPACPLAIISVFSARTSAFIGNRLEFYIIARHAESGRMSWIIADYETNTNSYDPKNCFSGYTCDPAVFTTTPYGELLAHFAGKKNGKEFSLSADLEKGEWGDLNEELWVEGNLSIDYGGELKVESSKPFSLIFDPFLMKKALRMPAGSIDIKKNGYLSGIVGDGGPICAALFPYSQHFIIKQDLEENAVANEADLHLQVNDFLARSGFKTMSGDDIKKPLLAGMLVSALLTYGIIIFLAIKLLLR
jgi:hypothetical protein